MAVLTLRELAVFDGVARGLSNKEIAASLRISESTVKNHLTAILAKLQVRNRTMAVAIGVQRGWIAGRERRFPPRTVAPISACASVHGPA